MSTVLDIDYLRLSSYVKSPQTRELLEEVYELIKKENRDNILALLPIYDHSTDTWHIDWDKVNSWEVEVLTGEYIDREGNCYSRSERDSLLEKWNSELESKEDSDIERLIEDLEEAECNPDEVYWDYVWRYNYEDPDIDIAESLGLGVLEYEGEQWIFLTGCGMDLSPKLVAYTILRYKGISREDIHHFRSKNSINYFKHVVGIDKFKEVINILGISELVN